MKNYEKKEIMIIVSILLIGMEIIFITSLFIKKEYTYLSITGMVSNQDLVLVMVNQKEKMILMKNKNILYNDKVLKYELLEDHGIIVKRNKEKYRELLLKINIGKDKINESITLTVKNKKISRIQLIRKYIGW